MSEELKAKVQAQFGAATDAYATSEIHAKGESLDVAAGVSPAPT